MNVYRLVALIIVIVVTVHVFDAKEAVTEFLNRIFDIPQFNSHGSNEPLFKLCVRIIYLITIVGVIKLIVGRDKSE
ncbi:hypothetical protein D1BOALGB6SA_7105 [Olavius sp. associated proteobacterium Delta 1]|nr:hypothetical protein D1BOALGB6SA_7105 [Olavius sp. associated proteobacterium Delta 1]